MTPKPTDAELRASGSLVVLEAVAAALSSGNAWRKTSRPTDSESARNHAGSTKRILPLVVRELPLLSRFVATFAR